MENILTHPTIASTLSNYPKPQWKRVIMALLLHSIHSLERHYHLSELSVDDLEALCGSAQQKKSRKNPELAAFMKELSTIKHEISRLDKKIDKTGSLQTNKENECPNAHVPKEEFNKRSTSQPAKRKERTSLNTYVVNRPSTAWRTQGERKNGRSYSPKKSGIYPSWWGDNARDKKDVNEIMKYERVRAQNMVPTIRAARKQAAKTANRTAYPHPKRGKKKPQLKATVPTYLRNVQSRIIPEIERDRLEYKMKQQSQKRVVYNVPPQYMHRQEQSEEPELPTLGRKEGHLMEVADQCLGSSIISHFTRAVPRERLNQREDTVEEEAQYQYYPQEQQPEESARFQYSSEVQEENVRHSSNASINQRIPSKYEHVISRGTHAASHERPPKENEMTLPAHYVNEGRIPHYSETALMPSRSFHRVDNPMTTSVGAEDQRYIPQYGYTDGIKMYRRGKTWVNGKNESSATSEISSGGISSGSSGSSSIIESKSGDYECNLKVKAKM